MRSLLVLILLTFSLVGYGQIINFPDPNFKNALVNTKCVELNGDFWRDDDVDTNNDGEIDLNEALYVIHLDVSSNDISNLSGIENFKNLKSLYCSANNLESINLSNLFDLEVLICEFNLLKSLQVSNLMNLKELYCKNNLLSSLDVSKLVNLEGLWCSFNPIKSLELTNLTELKQLRCSGNELTNLDISNQKKLTDLTCSLNYLTNLDVIGLKSLKFLECAKNQISHLSVEGLNKLENLGCWDNLLQSLNVKTGSEILNIGFHGNPNLNYICCDENKITQIKNLVKLREMYCEVNSYCTFTPSEKFYILNGENIFDGNNDDCDDQDIKQPNVKINITNGSISGTFISNSTGNYSISVQAGTHTITPVLEYPEHFEVTPTSITITFPSTSDTITQNFCITPKGILRQTNITVIPLSPPARPGFDAQYKIVWENVGNQIESGTLNFTYDETLLDYISATQTADQVADGIVKWNFSNLQPFEKREITVTLKVNRPTDTPAVNAGDKLYLTASILDNIFTLENTVVGSYDPNDKTCLQGDRVKPDMVGKYIDYLIRFENTGNYAAENVVIKDIIDTKTFDMSSLQITDASHEVYTRIEGNKVEFIFENIQLPFDDANNDGYIAFKIKTLPTLVLGDSLKNLADIYFDYNFPIRTNEAQTTIALPSFTKDFNTEVNVYPNPVRDILYLESNENWSKAEIYDISGRIMRSVLLYISSIDVSGLESGTYFIRLKSEDKVGLVKLVKM